MNHGVEKLLERVETCAIPVLRELASGRAPRNLSDDERDWFAHFVALASVRVPKFRGSVEASIAEVMRLVALEGAHHAEAFAHTMKEAYAAKGLEPSEDTEAVRRFILSEEYTVTASPIHSLLALLYLAPTAAEYVFRYNWRILEAPPGHSFVTSDCPLVKVSTERLPPSLGWGTGWETPWMEATFPLSPARCLLISVHHPEGIETGTAEQTQEINWRTAAHATEAVYSSSMQLDPRSLSRPPTWSWWKPASSILADAPG